jgi:hypothetical protein
MTTPSRPGLLMAMIEIDPAHEEEFNRWYNEEHFPERADCPGFLSARRFKAVDGSTRYLALYDLRDPGVIEGPDYQAIKGPTEWTLKMRKYFKSIERHVFVEILTADDL